MTLSDEIDLIRKTANSLLAFKYERRTAEQWSKFWGCLDTLRDMDDTIYELLNIERKPTRAECIGFLQVLVSQQDSIYHLTECVGIKSWKPTDNKNLEKIRDLRNRITSHAAWSSRSKDGVNSTSMINWADIRVGGFKAVIYRGVTEDDFPLYEDIDFKEMLNSNISNLKLHIPEILKAMNKSEDKLKKKLQSLDWSFFDLNGNGYLIEKLWSPWQHKSDRLWQAKGHIEIFSERLKKAKDFFDLNEISEIDNYRLDALSAGAAKLGVYLTKKFPSDDEQLEYYVLLRGWVKLWREFDDEVIALKNKMDIK